MIFIILAVFAAYLLGSVPTAFLFGKYMKGIDIREHGSGNVGATNVFRTVGKIPGLIVFFLDALKGFVAVTFLLFLLKKVITPVTGDGATMIMIILGMATIAGHIWTIFLKFKGGKGVATTAGVMAGISPVIFISCLSVWILVFYFSRYISLASIIAAVFLPVFSLLYAKSIEMIIFCSILCMVGVYGHRSNIRRLIQGSEKKLV